METKMIKIPFDIELAKKITNGKVEGKIVTRDGNSVRIVCFDAKQDDPIVALISWDNAERVKSYAKNGIVFAAGTHPNDLILEVPEPLTFKDGVTFYNC